MSLRLRFWSALLALLFAAASARADPPSVPPRASLESAPPAPAPQPAPSPPSVRVRVPPGLARGCVAAALQASGLAEGDAAIDALISRARMSAWLPETRMRATTLLDDASHATTLATTDGTNYYEAVGSDLVLELSLTWRFDRVLYTGDEAALERVRLMRQRVRSRVATRTLELLFAWQRASIDAADAPSGTREELDAWLHASEAEAKLDVITGGWFSRKRNDSAPEPEP